MKKLFLLFVLVGMTFLSCSENSDDTLVSANTDLTSTGQLYAAKLIDGQVGDELEVNSTFVNAAGNEITVYARLRILPGAFEDTINIAMIPNVEDLSITFYPEITFNRDIRLDLTFEGIDLESYGYTTTGTVDFAFFAINGNLELIENDKSIVNIPQKKISVQNAKLYHFSRYGWIR